MSRDHAQEAQDAVKCFLGELKATMYQVDDSWRDWIADKYRGFQGRPTIPAFLRFEILGEEADEESPVHVKYVKTRLQLVPSGAFGIRHVDGVIRALCETPTGLLRATGKWKVDPTSWRYRGRS